MATCYFKFNSKLPTLKSKKMKNSIIISLLLLALIGCDNKTSSDEFTTYPKSSITIDFDTTLKTGINKGVAGANLCWLLDSDLPTANPTQSMRSALKELGVGSLRFPYGALAENYLWDSAPYDSEKPIGQLNPKVASTSTNVGTWSWATNPDGTFKKAMDFDEFMDICQDLEIEPLVVVSIHASKFNGGPTPEELVTSAVEWVKYAKSKNYNVAYWQIGNEVDHSAGFNNLGLYVERYQEMVTAMKAEDPTIKVGPGILSSVGYFNAIINSTPELIDFVSAHQYMFSFINTSANYDLWKEDDSNFTPNVFGMQNAVAQSSKPTMDIVVTETGVTTGVNDIGFVNNTYKALWWFDVLMTEIGRKNVAYSYFWGTHSPWNGGAEPVDNLDKDVGLLLRLDDNSRKPTAEIIKLVNENMLDNLVKTTTGDFSGYVKTYAGVNDGGTKHTIFLMNRNNEPEEVILQLNNLPDSVNHFTRKEFKGTNPEDRNPLIEETGNVSVLEKTVRITLPPLSVTFLNN